MKIYSRAGGRLDFLISSNRSANYSFTALGPPHSIRCEVKSNSAELQTQINMRERSRRRAIKVYYDSSVYVWRVYASNESRESIKSVVSEKVDSFDPFEVQEQVPPPQVFVTLDF
jgi:hypothetical protein